MTTRSLIARWWIYERRWRRAMLSAGLGQLRGRRTHVPSLLAVTSGGTGHRVLVALLPGQTLVDVERAAPELAWSFGAATCEVREDRPGRVWLDLTPMP